MHPTTFLLALCAAMASALPIDAGNFPLLDDININLPSFPTVSGADLE
jgi:hypothetical protein